MVGKIYLAKIYFTERIKLTNDDLIDGNLKKDSLIIVPKNFTLHKTILNKYIGQLNNEKLSNIFDSFCDKIGCK
jgi:mRNA interferase MazF